MATSSAAASSQALATVLTGYKEKLDKLGLDKVKLELTGGYIDESGAEIRGLGLQNSQVDKIEQFLQISGETRSAVFTQLKSLFTDAEDAEQEIALIGGRPQGPSYRLLPLPLVASLVLRSRLSGSPGLPI